MSYIQRKANYAYGIQNYLSKKGIDVSGRGSKVNKIMVEFLKSKDLPYMKWNPKYRGINTADLINAEAVQEHFKDFRVWTDNNIDKLLNPKGTS